MLSGVGVCCFKFIQIVLTANMPDMAFSTNWMASRHLTRGETTQLLLAAKNGHDSVVERLLEAKAAVDQKDNEGRGLGQGLGGKFCEACHRCGEVNEICMVQFSWWILLSIYL